MPKKLLISLLLSSLLAPLTTLTLAAVDPKAVENIQVEFCNQQGVVGKKLRLGELAPNTPTEICLTLRNTSQTALPVLTNFVDGVTTSDGEHIACRDETDAKQGFAKFVDLPEPAFTLPAGATVTKKATLQFPAEFSGETAGCFTYRLGEQTLQQGTLNVILRKANIIQVRVKGDVQIGLAVQGNPARTATEETLAQAEELTIKKDRQTGKVYSELLVENTGNVKLAFNAHAKVQGPRLIAAAKEQALVLLPGESKVISSEKVEPPFLGGKFEFATEIAYEPQFEFAPMKLAEKTGEAKATTTRYQTKTFITPETQHIALLILGGSLLVVSIFALIKLFSRRK